MAGADDIISALEEYLKARWGENYKERLAAIELNSSNYEFPPSFSTGMRSAENTEEAKKARAAFSLYLTNLSKKFEDQNNG